MSEQHIRQWRIVALAVVSSSGRPLFLKNFPPAASTGDSLSPGSVISTPSVSNLDVFTGDAKKFLAPWALKMTGAYHNGNGNGNLVDDDSGVAVGDDVSSRANSATTAASAGGAMDLQQALAAALDCEDYTETETAQLFLYAALDRIDARRATEERRSGNPFESRGYAVFDRETRTRMKAFVLVRYWGRSLPSDCVGPCQAVLNQLIQKATYAYCDPFRDAALDEPLSESLVLDPFLTGILRSATELPSGMAGVNNSTPGTSVASTPMARR